MGRAPRGCGGGGRSVPCSSLQRQAGHDPAGQRPLTGCLRARPAGTAAGQQDAAAADRQARAEQALSLTLFCALCGFFMAAFFLSRSYNIMLYTLAAIVVGHYASMRQRHDTLPRFTLSVSGWRWLPIALVAVVVLYVLVTVLLRMP